jgi:hypothetical protein
MLKLRDKLKQLVDDMNAADQGILGAMIRECEICGASVSFVASGRRGIFEPISHDNDSVMQIKLSHPMPVIETIIILSHEMGHMDQFIDLVDGDIDKWAKLINIFVNRSDLEGDAWYRAIGVLRRYKFSMWSLFILVAKECYRTYLNAYSEEKQYEALEKFTRELEDAVKSPVFAY